MPLQVQWRRTQCRVLSQFIEVGRLLCCILRKGVPKACNALAILSIKWLVKDGESKHIVLCPVVCRTGYICFQCIHFRLRWRVHYSSSLYNLTQQPLLLQRAGFRHQYSRIKVISHPSREQPPLRHGEVLCHHFIGKVSFFRWITNKRWHHFLVAGWSGLVSANWVFATPGNRQVAGNFPGCGWWLGPAVHTEITMWQTVLRLVILTNIHISNGILVGGGYREERLGLVLGICIAADSAHPPGGSWWLQWPHSCGGKCDVTHTVRIGLQLLIENDLTEVTVWLMVTTADSKQAIINNLHNHHPLCFYFFLLRCFFIDNLNSHLHNIMHHASFIKMLRVK